MFKKILFMLVISLPIYARAEDNTNINSNVPDLSQIQSPVMQESNTNNLGNRFRQPSAVNTRLYEFAGTGVYDGSLEITGRGKVDKYLEIVGVSTPTAPSTGRARVFVSSATRQVCAEFDNSGITCMASAVGVGGSNNQIQVNSGGSLTASSSFTWTGSSLTVNGGVNIASSTFLPGATFYQNGGIVLGTPGFNVTLSSNVIMPGATFYQNGTAQIGNVNFTGTVSGISGRIIQIVTANATTAFTTTSNAYQTTNLSASITPSSTSNKIFVLATGTVKNAAFASANAFVTLFRGSTALGHGANNAICDAVSGTTFNGFEHCAMSLVDSPASTSSLTYTVKVKNDDSATTVGFGDNEGQEMILLEIAQ